MSETIGFNPGETKRFGRMPTESEVQPTLRASDGKIGDNSPTVAIGVDSYNQTANHEVLDTIRTSGSGDNYPKVAVGFSASNSDMSLATKPTPELGQTVRSAPRGEGAVVMSYDGYNQSGKEECCHALDTCNSESPNNDKVVKIATKQAIDEEGMTMQEPRDIADIISLMRYIVRRLTPTECERLMGLPDGWTIPSNLVITDALVEEFRQIHDNFNRIMAEYEGAKPPKPKTVAQVRKWLERITNPETCPDAPRYKGCGNGWATNQPRWVLTRLLRVEGIDPFVNEE